MSATLPPYRSEQPLGHDGFTQLVRAEFTKFRTVRSWVITLGIAGVLIVVLASVLGPHRPGGICLGESSSQGACTPAATSRVTSLPVGPGGEPVVDTYSLVHQRMTGNGTFTARVTSLTSVGAAGNGPGPVSGVDLRPTPGRVPWAKAGLIITSSTIPGSTYAAVMATPGHGVRMQYDYTGDLAGLSGTPTTTSPRWLRLTRAGKAITGYDSLNGTQWTKIGTIELPGLAPTVQVGMFATSPLDYTAASAASATLSTATFDEVQVTGVLPGSWGNEVVHANPEGYATWPTGGNWFQHSDDRFTISGSGDVAPQVAGGTLLSQADTRRLMAGGIFGLLAIIVLAALFVTAEYRRGLIRTTFTASPRRGRVLLAKSVVIGAVSFPVASVATAIAVVITRRSLAADGTYQFPIATATEVRVILGTGLLFAIAAIGVLALATVLRRSSGAIVIGIVAFAVPFIILSAPGSAAIDWFIRVTPVAGFAIQGTLPRYAQVAGDYSLGSGYYPLTPWVGLAVLSAWVGLALGAAHWSLRHRDV